jgi:mycofactocin precursor
LTATTQENMTATTPRPAAEGSVEPAPEDLVQEDLLVEDVSIDGMCGVY